MKEKFKVAISKLFPPVNATVFCSEVSDMHGLSFLKIVPV